jgi:peptide/nickel transport system ATP-binding protein
MAAPTTCGGRSLAGADMADPARAAASTAPGPVLAVHDLTVAIGPRAVVDGVSFALGPGETLALVGESGCGKSLTALALLQLLPGAARLAGGTIGFEGADLARLDEARMREIRGNRASIIFQDPLSSLDPLMTVGDQLVEGILAHRAVGRAAARAEALAMLRAVGIAEAERRLAQYPFELSGGMCQRVMIAIALAARPAVLIADEPTTALDVTIQAQILDLMKALRRESGTSILLITHDMGVVADMADRVAVMYAGRIVETGPTDAIFASPRHPYTHLLLRSVPRLDDRPKTPMAVIEGSVPAHGDWPPGCRFAPRCPLAVERCVVQPPLDPVAPARAAACWRHEAVPTIGTAAGAS